MALTSDGNTLYVGNTAHRAPGQHRHPQHPIQPGQHARQLGQRVHPDAGRQRTRLHLRFFSRYLYRVAAVIQQPRQPHPGLLRRARNRTARGLSSLTVIGGTERRGATGFQQTQPGQPPAQVVVNTGQRNVAAVATVSETSFIRLTTPVRQNITAVTRDDPMGAATERVTPKRCCGTSFDRTVVNRSAAPWPSPGLQSRVHEPRI